jgi:hypothetical protein
MLQGARGVATKVCRGSCDRQRRFDEPWTKVLRPTVLVSESSDGASGRQKCYWPLPELLQAVEVLLQAAAKALLQAAVEAAVEGPDFFASCSSKEL